MLSGKDKRYLRSLANSLTSITQVGKDGLSKNLFNSINDAFNNRELIKINILKSCEDEIDVISQSIVNNCECELVQKIGKTLVFYKRNKEPKLLV